MKSEILRLLKEEKGYLSGQYLSECFGVSRTAVWKAIEQLKKSGYEIEAVRNKGYRLTGVPDTLIKEEIESRIGTKKIGKHLTYFEELDSTNIKARRLGEEKAADGTLVVTDRQVSGKGRRGKEWESPPGENIYMSLLLYPEFMPDVAPMLTLIMALSVVSGIKKSTGIDAQIKWPNDIVLKGKKICGILTEMSAQTDYINYVVIGVGINVNQQDFPGELKEKATSLQMEGESEFDRALIIAETMNAFEKYYERFLEEESMCPFKEEYNGLLVNKNKEVLVMDPKGSYKALGLGIGDTGELLIQMDDGSIRKINAGEVSVRGILGYV